MLGSGVDDENDESDQDDHGWGAVVCLLIDSFLFL